MPCRRANPYNVRMGSGNVRMAGLSRADHPLLECFGQILVGTYRITLLKANATVPSTPSALKTFSGWLPYKKYATGSVRLHPAAH